MKRYSNDLRKKVIENIEIKKDSIRNTSKIFSLSRETIYSWLELNKQGELYDIKNYQTKKSKIDYNEIKKYVEENPDLYNFEIGKKFNTSRSNIQRILIKLGFTVKKNKQHIKNKMN